MNRKLRAWATAALLAVFALPAFGIDPLIRDERQTDELAPGVYLIRHKDPIPGWVNGNTTVIVGEREVLVVDSCQLPYFAKEDVAQIRQWTSKPVRWLVNTHWHQDHNGGNNIYLDAFPGLAIVAHPMTSEMMANTSPNASREMQEQLSSLHDRLAKRLETGKEDDGVKPLTDERRAVTQKRLAQIEQVTAGAKQFVVQLPTLTFDHELTIDLGGREVRVMHPGRGNTAGDVVVYLPKEKILLTGDLVVSPVPFAFDGYPTEWIATLGKLDQMDAALIVPGHGSVMHDKAYMRMVAEMMKAIVEQVQATLRKNNDLKLEDVKKAIDVKAYREKFCPSGSDANCAGFFDLSVGEKFVELAFHEAKAR
jgi:cyclase